MKDIHKETSVRRRGNGKEIGVLLVLIFVVWFGLILITVFLSGEILSTILQAGR